MAEETKKRTRYDRSEEVLAFIRKYSAENGRPPTEREIMRGVGLNSTSAAHHYKVKLKDDPRLMWTGKAARGLAIHVPSNVHISEKKIAVPGLGNIAAGAPILIPGEGAMIYDPVFTVDVPPSYIPSGVRVENLYALKVKGDSMRDAMIHDQDVVLIYKTDNVTNGDIVVAWIIEEETTTLKRIRETPDGLWLEPENPSPEYKPMFFSRGQVEIQGKVLGVIRLYQ